MSAAPLRTMLDHALAIAAEGRPVFPLEPNSKAPRHGLTGGFYNATTDVKKIRAFWAESPQSNIGVRCERHPVVDLDLKHGGYETLEALPEEQRQSLLQAPQVRTPGG